MTWGRNAPAFESPADQRATPGVRRDDIKVRGRRSKQPTAPPTRARLMTKNVYRASTRPTSTPPGTTGVQLPELQATHCNGGEAGGEAQGVEGHAGKRPVIGQEGQTAESRYAYRSASSDKRGKPLKGDMHTGVLHRTRWGNGGGGGVEIDGRSWEEPSGDTMRSLSGTL